MARHFHNELNVKVSCNYLSTEEFSNYIDKKEENLSYLSLNVRSLRNKREDVRDLLISLTSSHFHFSCVSLQEVWGEGSREIDLKMGRRI